MTSSTGVTSSSTSARLQVMLGAGRPWAVQVRRAPRVLGKDRRGGRGGSRTGGDGGAGGRGASGGKGNIEMVLYISGNSVSGTVLCLFKTLKGTWPICCRPTAIVSRLWQKI